jgi:hypothetical protein
MPTMPDGGGVHTPTTSKATVGLAPASALQGQQKTAGVSAMPSSALATMGSGPVHVMLSELTSAEG